MENKSDPRTTNWFMMDSPIPTIMLSATYIVIVKVSIHHKLTSGFLSK